MEISKRRTLTSGAIALCLLLSVSAWRYWQLSISAPHPLVPYIAYFTYVLLICLWLVPPFSVTGAAVALVAGNAVMFLYRTVTGQYYYRTIPNIPRTVSGFLLALAATTAGVVFYEHFWLKFAAVAAILFVYCTLYRPQLQKLWQLAMGLLRKLAARRTPPQ